MLKTLFDVHFNELITRRVISAVYGIALALIVLGSIISLIAFLADGGWLALFGLVFVPLMALLQLLIARVVAETVLVYFRIADDVREMRNSGFRA